MSQNTHSERSLYVAFEIGNKEWKLAFGDGRQEREVTIRARDQEQTWKEIAKAKEKLGLAANAKVYSCYEAGRDGFWIHRMLTKGGVCNVVVDPASIEVNRRAKQRKTDRLDARKLRGLLLRYWRGEEKKVWIVLHVPSEEDEARRRRHREAERLKKERTAHFCRIRSLLVLYGLNPRGMPEEVGSLRDWEGKALPEELVSEIQREQERLEWMKKQLKSFQQYRKERMKKPELAAERMKEKMQRILGVGEETAWNLAHEFFGWRDFRNRREVGAAAGMVGTPYDSGDSHREQGISKAGNARVRVWATELAWRWLMFQPKSKLARWYERRFGGGGQRMRRIGIVALARKILVALWKYLTWDEVPAGVVLKKA